MAIVWSPRDDHHVARHLGSQCSVLCTLHGCCGRRRTAAVSVSPVDNGQQTVSTEAYLIEMLILQKFFIDGELDRYLRSAHTDS